MSLYEPDPEVEAVREAKWKRWGWRARYVHDTALPPRTWTVDDERQEDELTAESLDAALSARTSVPGKRIVAVSAPLHVELTRIIGHGIPLREFAT